MLVLTLVLLAMVLGCLLLPKLEVLVWLSRRLMWELLVLSVPEGTRLRKVLELGYGGSTLSMQMLTCPSLPTSLDTSKPVDLT